MSTWQEFNEQAPELAAFTRSRIEATGLGLLATLRADGSPRISGLEPFIAGRHLWLAMMPDSVKGADLRRDGRFALHNATVDKDVAEGDVKISGVARPVTEAADREVLADALGGEGGFRLEDVEAFWADLTGVASIRVGGDHLIIDSWLPGQPVRTRRRQ